MNAWKFRIEGIVQGVGFRASVYYFVTNNIPTVTGYAKNLSDGSVEVLAFGKDEELTLLEEFLWKGSSLARVNKVIVQKNITEDKLEGFRTL